MSSVEHPKEYYNIPIIKKDKYSIIAEMIHTPYNELAEKKCCDNCEYNSGEYCNNDVSNVYCENYLESTDTFYCSYHKFKV